MIIATKSTSSRERARELLKGLCAPLNEPLADGRLAEAKSIGEAGRDPFIIVLREPQKNGLLHLVAHFGQLLHSEVALR